MGIYLTAYPIDKLLVGVVSTDKIHTVFFFLLNSAAQVSCLLRLPHTLIQNRLHSGMACSYIADDSGLTAGKVFQCRRNSTQLNYRVELTPTYTQVAILY